MVETSGRSVFDVKELCAIESVAKHHPKSAVYFLTTSPTVSYRGAIVDMLAQYPNINVKYLNFEAFLMGTPLEAIWRDGRLEGSKYLLSHISDILR